MDIYCTSELPSLTTFLATLPDAIRAVCKGTSWDAFHVGGVSVTVLPGRARAPHWPHAYKQHVELDGRAGADWSMATEFASSLVRVTRGAVIHDGEVTESRASSAKESSRCARRDAALEKAIADRAPTALGKALRAIANHEGDLAVCRRACERALAAAVHDGSLLDQLARLMLPRDEDDEDDAVLDLESATHDGLHLSEWIARLQLEGTTVSPACERYALQVRTLRARTWAEGHPAREHARDVMARFAAGDAEAKVIIEAWRGDPSAGDALAFALEQALATYSTAQAAWAAPLSALAVSLETGRRGARARPWSDAMLAAIHPSDRERLLAARAEREAACAAADGLSNDIARRNAERLAQLFER